MNFSKDVRKEFQEYRQFSENNNFVKFFERYQYKDHDEFSEIFWEFASEKFIEQMYGWYEFFTIKYAHFLGLISHKELKQLSDNRYIFHQKFPNAKNAESFFESIDNFLEIQEKFVTQTLKYAIQFFEAGKNFAKKILMIL